MIVSLKPIKEETTLESCGFELQRGENRSKHGSQRIVSPKFVSLEYHTRIVEIRNNSRENFFFFFPVVPTLLQTLTTFNYTVFPDGDGVPHLVHLDNTPLSLEEVDLLNNDLNTITFTLFTRSELFLYLFFFRIFLLFL